MRRYPRVRSGARGACIGSSANPEYSIADGSATYIGTQVHMTNRNIRDLIIGVTMISASVYLWCTGQYTIEIAVLIGVLTVWWLLT